MLPAPAEGSPVAERSRQCTSWAARHIQQQQPPTEKFASSKMQCPLGRAEGRGSGHKSMPRRACVPRGLECERRVCVSLVMSRHIAYVQRNDPAPYGAVRPSVFGCGNLRRLVRTFGWSPTRDTRGRRRAAASLSISIIILLIFTGRFGDADGSARPGAALGGRRSRRAVLRDRAQSRTVVRVVARPPRSTIR